MIFFVCLLVVFIPLSICVPIVRVGKKNLKKLKGQNYIISCNHMSNWDAVMLDVKFFRKHLFLAKIELFKSKFSSFFLKKFGAVPVDRSKTDTRAVKEIFRQLNKGKRLAIFPQATRAKSPIIQGETAKEGVALFAIRNNLPVVPMMYDRKIRPFHKTKLIIGEPIYPDPERKRDKEYLDEFATLVIDKMNELIK